MSDFGRLKSIGVSLAVVACMLTLVGCPGSLLRPEITGADREEVPATIPTVLTINGTGFGQNAVVIFGNDDLGTIAEVPATTVAANGTSLTVTTPVIDIEEDTVVNYCVANVDLVGANRRVSEHVDILYGAPPQLASVFPAEVPAQVPTQIAISGENLDPGADVCFLSNVGQFGCDTLSAGQTVETAALSGTVGPTLVSVKITNDDGQMDVLTGAILYEAAPTVLTVMPDVVPATIPTDIMIFGTGFDNGATVSFLDDEGNVVASEFFELDCDGQCADTQKLAGKSPVVTGLTDDVCLDVTVSFPNGTSTEPVVKALGTLCLAAPPQVASIAPEDVPAATTETQVTLTGPNLREGSSIIARVPGNSPLVFGNGLGCESEIPDIPEIPNFPVKQLGYGEGCAQNEVEIPADEVEFNELVAGGELTFVRPVIEDNPSTPTFEGVRENVGIEFAVVDEWGQESEDVVVVQYNTSPRILGVSPLVIPATIPITFVATMSNISLNGAGEGDLEFYWYNASDGSLGASLGTPSAELWEVLEDPNVEADPLVPSVGVRAIPPQYAGIINPNPQWNVAAVVTNADGQQAIYPVTYSGQSEILSVRNAETGYAEVGATEAYGLIDIDKNGNSYLPEHFPIGRNLIIEGFDFNNTSYEIGDIVEVRFSRGTVDPEPGLDEDGTLLDIVQGTVQNQGNLGVQYIAVEAPAFPCGELEEDELIQVRVMKQDGQGTRESAVGAVNYKAQPRLISAVTIPNPEAVHGDDQFPATIPTIFEVEVENFASSLYLGKPREQVAFLIPSDDEDDDPFDFIDVHYATVPFTTGTSDPHQTPLVGVELLSSPEITEGDVARGRTPAIFGLTEHTDVAVVAIDKYGQASIESLEECSGVEGNPFTLEALAPPQIASFLTTVENCEGAEVTLPSVAPGTDQVDATFEIVGSLFTPGITAKFYRTSEFDSDKGIYVGVGEPFAEISGDDLGGDFDESITGAIPPLLGPTEPTELNVSIVLCAADLQMSEAFPGIKYLGLPTVQKVRVQGSETEGTPDSGDSFFVTNGPFRNAINVDDDPTYQGPEAIFEIVGQNLDCRSPITGEGSVDITLTAGADAIEESFYNSDSSGSILSDPEIYGFGATDDRSLGRIAFGIPDRAQTYNLNGTPDMRSMTDGFGVLDMTLCDCTGQTASYDNVLATIQGPTAPGEGNAIAFATGDVNGDDLDDVATLVAAASAYYGYTTRLNVWFGTGNDTIQVVPNFTYDIGNDPANPDAGVSAFDATLSARRMVIGDFKNDGRGDIVIGMPDRNFEGAPYGDNGNAPASSFGSGTDGYVVYFEGIGSGIDDAKYIQGPGLADSGFGTSIGAGYINNDAFEDLVVSAPGFDVSPVAIGTGRAYVFFGGPNFAQGITPPGEDFFITPGNANPNDFFGLGLAVGDYNNDGFADVFAGSPGFDTESGATGAIVNTGRTYQYNGGNSIDDIPDFEYAFGANEERYEGGYPVIADFDGDGIDDLLIGRPGPGNDGDHTGDAVIFQGADGSPIDENGIIVPTNEEGLPLFSWLAGKGGTIVGYDDGGVLFGVPDFNSSFLPLKQVEFADSLYIDDFRFYEGVVQNFPASASFSPLPSPLNVGVDTSDSLFGFDEKGDGFGDYLNLSFITLDDSAYPGDFDFVQGAMYGILNEVGNVLAGEGDDFFIALPGLGAVPNSPFTQVQTGGGLVIVPNGLDFAPALVIDEDDEEAAG